MNWLIRLLPILAALAFGGAAEARPAEQHMTVALRAETAQVAPGGSVTLALVMQPKSGWHGYWQNPGDAGAPNRIRWSLPVGASVGDLLYPVPQRLLVSDLMNYVYEGRYAAVGGLRVPSSAKPGAVVPVRAHIDYLVCTDRICVPESADVALDLRAGSPGARDPAFDGWRAALPRPLGAPARFERKGGRLRLGVALPAAAAVSQPYFFPLTEGALTYSAPQSVSRNGDWLVVEVQSGDSAPASVKGVLAIGAGQGLAVAASPGPVPAAGEPLGSATPRSAPSILLALAGALVGGLLLNVMPCVFPILSLKALSLARAGTGEREARLDALAYAAGVVLVCVGLGAILLVLRAGGAAVGWAFQLQDPRVTLFLLLLVAAITLNLAGLFELPSVEAGGRLAERGGTIGAFWTGALAAFVATPCTGPFMGAALGAALVLSPPAALAVFAGLGVGLALPFLLLGFVPALRRRMPKPGPWMVRFRQILAVPMALTALWLGWLLWRQAGNVAAVVGGASIVLVGAALGWAGKRHRWIALLPATAAVAAGVLVVPTALSPATGGNTGAVRAEPFSEARLAALRAEGRPVFVYFTADWCLTCKVNEKAVLERAPVARAFERGKVAVLVGDWTRGDAAIGRFLEKQGRSGVPLYLWYASGKEAEVLPQILTVGRVAGLAG